MSKFVGFLADSALKFSTETDIFVKFPQNETFSNSSIVCSVQCFPEEAVLMEKFCSWYLMERFFE